MNYKLLSLCIVVIGVCTYMLHNCFDTKPAASDDEPVVEPDVPTVEFIGQTFVYGRLGDGTGMGGYEFVTVGGDTLYPAKVDEFTGLETVELGTDLMQEGTEVAMLLNENGDALSASVAVNMTQLRQRWQRDGQGFELSVDSTVANVDAATTYRRWLMCDDNLVLTRTVRHEGGVGFTTDTLRVVSLTADSLVLRNHYGDTLHYCH